MFARSAYPLSLTPVSSSRYGCDVYNSGVYTSADKLTMTYTDFGIFSNYDCYKPYSRPVVSVIFFTFFVLVSAFVMLSLFVGAVCNGALV